MNQGHVLVIDDEPQIRRLLSVALTRQGYRVDTAASGEEGIDRLAVGDVDLVLLDLGLPDRDGADVCRELRSWSDIPIIVVSVRDEDAAKIASLDLGADDYVTKPFSIDELLARVRANLRRTRVTVEEPVLTVGSVQIDLARRRVTHAGQDIHLTPTEYELLRVLVSHRGRVMTHRQLLREVRGPSYEGDTPLLRVHMVGLRQKIGVEPGSPGYITTEPGIGYRLLE